MQHRLLSLGLLLLLAPGCAAGKDDGADSSEGSAGGGSSQPSTGMSGVGSTGGAGAASSGDTGGFNATGGGSMGGGDAGMSLIYAHTDTTLYRLDPASKALAMTSLGEFDCVGGAGQD